MKDSVFFIFDQDAYYASQNSGSSGRDGDSTTTPPKKYLIPTAGVENKAKMADTVQTATMCIAIWMRSRRR